MEPLNNGHIGTRHFVLYREVVPPLEVKNVGKESLGPQKCVLYRGFFHLFGVSVVRGSTVCV